MPAEARDEKKVKVVDEHVSITEDVLTKLQKKVQEPRPRTTERNRGNRQKEKRQIRSIT
jgi:hypothetical protein